MDAASDDLGYLGDAGTGQDALVVDHAGPPDGPAPTDLAPAPDTGDPADALVFDSTTADAAGGSDAIAEDSASADARPGVDASALEDASATADAALPACTNPFDTCGQGFKCTYVGDGPSPTTVHLACAVDGDVADGQPCRFDENGVDDCVSGLFCTTAYSLTSGYAAQNGVCKEICSLAPNSCPEQSFCQSRALLGSSEYGSCEPFCNVILNDCPEGEGCYLNPVVGEGLCSVPKDQPADTGCGYQTLPPGTQDDCCSYMDSCAIGYGCIGRAADGFGLACAAYCDPSETIGSSDCAATVGGGYYCLGLKWFYSDADHLPDYMGMCIAEATWGPATCFNNQQDTDEDGIDCCLTSGECRCAWECS